MVFLKPLLTGNKVPIKFQGLLGRFARNYRVRTVQNSCIDLPCLTIYPDVRRGVTAAVAKQFRKRPETAKVWTRPRMNSPMLSYELRSSSYNGRGSGDVQTKSELEMAGTKIDAYRVA